MGVYVYRSKHMDAVKIGHYFKQNAWSRIAHRGFYSCLRPEAITDKVGVEDVDLVYWYPGLSKRFEHALHATLAEYRLCGEWFVADVVDLLPTLVTEENQAATCSKEEALASDKRL